MKKIVIAILGILFVLLGFYIIVHENNKTKHYNVKTEGVIKDIIMNVTISPDGKQKTEYFPVVEYKVNGKEISVKSSYDANKFSSKFNKKKGDKITIYYNPKAKDRFIIKGFKPSHILVIVVGIIFIICGIFFPIMVIVFNITKEDIGNIILCITEIFGSIS